MTTNQQPNQQNRRLMGKMNKQEVNLPHKCTNKIIVILTLWAVFLIKLTWASRNRNI